MPMIWDAPLTAAVALELDSCLAGQRLRAHLFDWERRELVLFFRTRTLRWSLHPDAGWISLLPPQEPPPESRPMAADLIQVEAPPDERFLRLRFRKVRGRVRTVQVIVELMSNQWNALLVEGREEWIRHLLRRRPSEGRDLSVGSAYQEPSPSTRAGIHRPLTDREWEGYLEVAVEGSEEVGEAGEAKRILLDTLAFTSSINVYSLLSDPEAHALWMRLRALDSTEPCLLELDRGKQPYPLVLKEFPHTRFPTLLEALEAAADADGQDHRPEARVMEGLEKAIRQARGRVRGIERELQEAIDPEAIRQQANLILARLGEIPKGVAEVTVKDFKDDLVTLPLDPALSPHENAEALYREAARKQRAQDRLPSLVDEARGRVEELTRLKEGLKTGTIPIQEAQEFLPARGEGGARKPDQTVRLPFKRYMSSSGLEILVGRGPADNDELTFRHARPQDVWLHARGSGGAHVVLRWSGTEVPPSQDLTEAAILAALHSGARHAGVVPVDWTRRKYVRKPRKAPAGTVRMEGASTLFVEPDPTLPKRLEWKG